MARFLRKYPIHGGLLIIYVLVTLINHNFQVLNWQLVHRTVWCSLALMVILSFLVLKVHRNNYKSALLYTIILAPILLYGAIYDLFEELYYKGLWPFQNIHRYLLVTIFLMTLLCIYKISKTERLLQKATYVLNILFLSLIFFNLFFVAIKIACIQKTTTISEKNYFINPGALPDIYYILLDGYANEAVLNKHYNYNNSAFITEVRKNNFTVFDSARTSYYGTSRSLTSIFNLTYPETHNGEPLTFKKNIFFRELKKLGYTIVQLESGYNVSDNCDLEDKFVHSKGLNEFEQTLLKLSIFRLDDLFGIIPYIRLKSQLEKMNELPSEAKHPQFIFIHIVAPHPPFVFDENGQRNITIISHENSWEPKTKYLNQLTFINKEILDFVSRIPEKNTAVIIQSDHGPWIKSKDKKEIYDARSLVLNAIRFPGKTLPVKNLNLVNTFRLFIKIYIDSTYTMLPFIEPAKQEFLESARVQQLSR